MFDEDVKILIRNFIQRWSHTMYFEFFEFSIFQIKNCCLIMLQDLFGSDLTYSIQFRDVQILLLYHKDTFSCRSIQRQKYLKMLPYPGIPYYTNLRMDIIFQLNMDFLRKVFMLIQQMYKHKIKEIGQYSGQCAYVKRICLGKLYVTNY